ncbi:MAG: hypothetical protein R3F30_04600 [Planctomycetota bacterium]
MSLTVPNDTGLVGTRHMLQTLCFDLKTFPKDLRLSNGVHLVVGNTW